MWSKSDVILRERRVFSCPEPFVRTDIHDSRFQLPHEPTYGHHVCRRAAALLERYHAVEEGAQDTRCLTTGQLVSD